MTAEIGGLERNPGILVKDLVDLSKAAAEINAAVVENADIRNNETAENQQTIIDSRDGQAAIETAIKVLKGFYATAGEAKA